LLYCCICCVDVLLYCCICCISVLLYLLYFCICCIDVLLYLLYCCIAVLLYSSNFRFRLKRLFKNVSWNDFYFYNVPEEGATTFGSFCAKQIKQILQQIILAACLLQEARERQGVTSCDPVKVRFASHREQSPFPL
jgi:hypothetical protein